MGLWKTCMGRWREHLRDLFSTQNRVDNQSSTWRKDGRREEHHLLLSLSSFYRKHWQEAAMEKVLFDVMAKLFTCDSSRLSAWIHHSWQASFSSEAKIVPEHHDNSRLWGSNIVEMILRQFNLSISRSSLAIWIPSLISSLVSWTSPVLMFGSQKFLVSLPGDRGASALHHL